MTPEPGWMVWVDAQFPYPLPAGVPECLNGQKVRVVRSVPGEVHVTIADADGAEYDLLRNQVKLEEFQVFVHPDRRPVSGPTPHRWLREDDPKLWPFLRAYIAYCDSRTGASSASDDAYRATSKSLREVLARNGAADPAEA